jgi:hypothetical protein
MRKSWGIAAIPVWHGQIEGARVEAVKMVEGSQTIHASRSARCSFCSPIVIHFGTTHCFARQPDFGRVTESKRRQKIRLISQARGATSPTLPGPRIERCPRRGNPRPALHRAIADLPWASPGNTARGLQVQVTLASACAALTLPPNVAERDAYTGSTGGSASCNLVPAQSPRTATEA